MLIRPIFRKKCSTQNSKNIIGLSVSIDYNGSLMLY